MQADETDGELWENYEVEDVSYYVNEKGQLIRRTEPGIGTRKVGQQGWFNDEQGKTLGMHWLEGSGTDLIFVNGTWGDYMRANQHINNILAAIIDNDIPTRKKSGTFHMKIFAETGVNDRSTGHGLLNGTQNFNVLMNVTVVSEKELHYSAILQWNDRIDPSARQGYTPWVKAAEVFYDPRDYDVSITWMQSFNVTRY